MTFFSFPAFAAPGLLGFLVVLPLLWWLLRLTPPVPRKVSFPAVMLLRDLVAPENTPARTPWWILLLRLAIAALLIVGFAQPVIDPLPAVTHHGDLLIVVDNDWAAARDWPQRQKILDDLLHNAAREHRNVTVLPTAPSASGDALASSGLLAAEAAASRIHDLAPEAWPSDWIQATPIAQTVKASDVVWLSSGLGGKGQAEFYAALQQIGAVRVLGTKNPIAVLQPPQNEGDNINLEALRPDVDATAAFTVDALSRDGNILARLPMTFAAGAPSATTPLALPLDIRNQITRFEIEGQRTAAATVLMDSAWEHRAVGLVGDASELEQHSLLSNLIYIDRALKPYADIHIAALDQLLKETMPVLILSGSTSVNDADIQPLKDWIKRGGVLVRFAGEHFDNPAEQDILPVTLRTGDRALGGALSWATPQKLQAFPAGSVFQGLAIPDDVTVSRQILAEPSQDLSGHVWASLQDGTPLVTARNIGKGMSLLFHISARADWSNLPLSGLFVDMLRRIVDLSRGMPQAGAAFSTLPPLRRLNAFGEEQNPDPAAQALTAEDFQTMPSPRHPPGLYGTDKFHKAFNLGASLGQPEAMRDIPLETFTAGHHELSLQSYFLLAAFMLLLLDCAISLFMRGLVALPRARTAALLFFICGLFPLSAQATPDQTSAVELTAHTTLAYIRTGEIETDTTSKLGLESLAKTLERRTSLDHVAVDAVDPEDDDLAFFPLIYWPLTVGAAPLSSEGAAHVNAYLHHGGMILFDAMNDEDPSPTLMKQALRGVDLPSLIHVPDNHVLKRSFYLLDDFPGRYAGHEFWLEPEDLSSYDGVATVLYGSHAWAAAWAMDAQGKPHYPCMPNGEVQRERAFRFGVNLVMYALTGNYKSDQLHVQALLEKVGK